MVYVSTKIKKSAAKAFEAERIDTETFSINKPEGFLNPVGDRSDLAFEAYSKDFGIDDAANIRHASATLRVHTGTGFTEVVDRAKSGLSELSRDALIENGRSTMAKFCGEIEAAGVPMVNWYKIISKDQDVYELKVAVLKEFAAEYEPRTTSMIESFAVK